jgi:phage host-nuclease inhibitor protein Gam
MPAKKLFISDQRMLRLLDWAIENKKAATETEYLDRIKFTRTNISNVRKGMQSFTKEHILNAATFTGANINWIFGLETNMMRKPGKTTMAMLREAVMAVEIEFGKSFSR